MCVYSSLSLVHSQLHILSHTYLSYIHLSHTVTSTLSYCSHGTLSIYRAVTLLLNISHFIVERELVVSRGTACNGCFRLVTSACILSISFSLSQCSVVSPSGEGGAQVFFPMSSSAPSSTSGDAMMWVCSYCTLPHTNVCEACSLPRQ